MDKLVLQYCERYLEHDQEDVYDIIDSRLEYSGYQLLYNKTAEDVLNFTK